MPSGPGLGMADPASGTFPRSGYPSVPAASSPWGAGLISWLWALRVSC